MKIAVCVKRVPDTGSQIRVAAAGDAVESEGVKHVMSPYDEFALEAALQLAEAAGENGEVALLAYGPPAAQEVLRSGLALGAHRAVLLLGEPSMDGWATAQVLAAELRHWDADLVLFGVKAVDSDQQQVGPMAAELLGRPCATAVASIDVADGVATCRRVVEGGHWVVELTLPAVATITKGKYEPRYASLRGIMAAKRKPLEQKAAEAPEPGFEIESLAHPPDRPPGRILGEGPGAAEELVRLLRHEDKAI